MPTEALAYLQGQILPAAQACLPIHDAGIVLGATVTEQTRTFAGVPFKLDDHLERLFGSLRHARLDPELTDADVRRISLELIAHNYPLLPAGGDLGLIQFVTAGEHAAYAGRPVRTGPTVCIHTFPLPFARWAKTLREGARLITPSVRHVPPECLPPAMKYRSRMHFYLADREAKDADPEASALLLDLAGNITETSTANFLFVKNGTLVSPTLRNILPGISLAVTGKLAWRRGLVVVERDFGEEAALAADEAFLTSTPYGILPVTRLNGSTIGSGQPGPVFRMLQAAWSEEVGMDIAAQIERGA
jgi:branched-subunit amino acid aminotransferase/4-amino-4-deoxychorismate lyase